MSADAFAETTFPFKFGFNVEPASNPQEVSSSIQSNSPAYRFVSCACHIHNDDLLHKDCHSSIQFLRNASEHSANAALIRLMIGLALFFIPFYHDTRYNDIIYAGYAPSTGAR
jgi:hypothetical protein